MAVSLPAGKPPRLVGRLRAWSLWSINPRGLAFLLAVEVVAAAGIGVGVATASLTPRVGIIAGGLVGLSTAYAELTDRVERLRRFLGADRATWSDRETVWMVAAALTLPAGAAGATVGALYLITLLRAHRHQAVRPHRLLFSAAAGTVAVLATATAFAHLGGNLLRDNPGTAAALVAAFGVFTAVPLTLVVTGIYLAARPPTLRAVLPGAGELGTELAAVLLGAMTAVLIVRLPVLAPASLVLLSVLHRSALVKQLETVAATDSLTGLLNIGAWRTRAGEHLDRAQRSAEPAAILLMDLDHFKAINDARGHPAGDAVLAAVADSLRAELRGYDTLGRYGGEEFIALLPATDGTEAIQVANRLRQRIGRIDPVPGVTVTTSIGVAIYPHDGITIEDLIQAADRALYAAKHAGRDRVALTGAG